MTDDKIWRPIAWRCPWCGALVLTEDTVTHGNAHVKHDAEHDGKDDDGDGD